MIILEISKLATVVRGSSPRPKGDNRYYGGPIPRLMVSDVTRDGMYVTPSIDSLTLEGAKKSRPMLEGDLIIAVSGDPGEPSILNVDACIHDGFVGLRNLDNSKVHTPYLYRFFKYFKGESKSQAVGAIYKNLNTDQIKKIKIPLPPLPIQKKIAAILDEADRIRQLNKQLIKKYDELTQSLFLDMFGDPVSNPMGWEKVPMNDLMRIVRGGSPRPIDNYLGGSYPWIKIGDATKGDDIYLNSTKQHITEDGLTKTRLLPKGSLIFANCGVSLGFARIITLEGCIHDGWLAFSEIDENILNKIFILKTLNSITRYFRETAPDGTQPNLNTAIMKNFKLILPPISLQNKFEKTLQVIETQKAQAQVSLQKSEELFNSLLQRAFKGELI